jgi:hypothetical protein
MESAISSDEVVDRLLERQARALRAVLETAGNAVKGDAEQESPEALINPVISSTLEDQLLGLTERKAILMRETSENYDGSNKSSNMQLGLGDCAGDEKEDSEAAHNQQQPDLGLMMGTLMSLMDSKGSEDGVTSDDGFKTGGVPFGTSFGTSSSSSKEDRLNLAGLLQVLDGVVDTPKRFVIITSNHPERLDPALIRPGRIDKRIHLGYVKPVHFCELVGHFFGKEPSQEQRKRIEAAVNGAMGRAALKLTPAQVEQLALEHGESIDQMIEELESKAGIFAPQLEAQFNSESCFPSLLSKPTDVPRSKSEITFQT